MDDAKHSATVGDHEGRATAFGDALDDARQIGRHRATVLFNPTTDRLCCAFADLTVPDVDAAHASLGGEVHELRVDELGTANVQSVSIFDEFDDRAALWRFVSQTREQRCLCELALIDPSDG